MNTAKKTIQIGQKTSNSASYIFKSLKERDSFYKSWERKQRGKIKFGSTGVYIGNGEILSMGGKTISIHKREQ